MAPALSGLRVLGLSTIVSGGMATSLQADFGAPRPIRSPPRRDDGKGRVYDPKVIAGIARAQAGYESRVREILAEADVPSASTQSGLPLKTLNTPADVGDVDYRRDLGFPGELPFTRGVQPTGYRTKEWTRRQVVGIGTAEETNARLRSLMSQGQTGFSVCGMGYANYDSDSEHALGFVGRGGVWIDTLADIETLLDGIDMRAVTVNQIGSSIPVFAMILAVVEARGIALGELRGTIQNWTEPGGEEPARRGNGSVDIEALAAAELADIPVVVGGIVPREDMGRLAALGVARVFQPGATFAQLADGFRAVGGAAAARRPSMP